MTLYSTADVAKKLKCDPATVHRAAKKLKPAPQRFGKTRAFMFTDRQVEAIAGMVSPGQRGAISHETAVANGRKGGYPAQTAKGKRKRRGKAATKR